MVKKKINMTTRESILEAVLKNQPPSTALPDIGIFKGNYDQAIEKYMEVFKTIGGSAFLVDSMDEIKNLITEYFDTSKRFVSTLPELNDIAELLSATVDPHMYEDIELAIINAHLFVAENGAVWVTDEVMGQRIIPYICQHLAVVVKAETVMPTLHEAYEKIGIGDYGFGGFIGGPSKLQISNRHWFWERMDH
jgi:L-lactate dehydrogenase complex protein LldG